VTGKGTTHIGLGIGIVVLVAMAALLLILLQSSQDTDRYHDPPTVTHRTAPPATPTRTPTVVRSVAPPKPPATASPTARRVTALQATDAGLRRVAPPPRPGPAPREPLGVHSAPAAIPVEIAHETDPVKKARLMRMHQLAVARSRASRFRRRLRMLQDTLARARQEKNWTAGQIASTEKDVAELKSAVTAAESRVKRAEKEVGQ
jgi:hypothetical protein